MNPVPAVTFHAPGEPAPTISQPITQVTTSVTGTGIVRCTWTVDPPGDGKPCPCGEHAAGTIRVRTPVADVLAPVCNRHLGESKHKGMQRRLSGKAA